MSKPEPKPAPSAPPAQKAAKEASFDFAAGVPLAAMAQNHPYPGTVGADEVVGVRQEQQVFVVAAKCSHYGAPLAKGRVVGQQIMCPWHHACFALRDGATTKAPGLAPLASFAVEIVDGTAYARRKLPLQRRDGVRNAPKQVTIVGAGAAAFSALAELRAQGYDGPIALIGGEKLRPYDRPKLSKAYLAGAVDDEAKLQLADDFLYPLAAATAQPTTWQLGQNVVALDVAARQLTLQDGSHHTYGSLIVATGAAPKKPKIAGTEQPHVHALRSLDDARRFKAAVAGGARVFIVGASFIGLEVAGALRQRDVDVTIVANQPLPMAGVLGRQLAEVLYRRHVQHGLRFVHGKKVVRIAADAVHFADGSTAAADVVLLATGVAPDTGWLQAAGLTCPDGLAVDRHLRAGTDEIFAAGDVARYPSPLDGQPLRIEHWAHAEQMGRVAARNVLGQHQQFADVPFFWTEHHDIKLRYVGHVRTLDHDEVFGDFEQGRAAVALFEGARLAAVATAGCDDISMACEAALAAGRPQEALEVLRTL